MKFENEIICGDWIEVLKGLPDDIFHCCVTSPPYWGQRDYGCAGQLGLEKTPEEHIEKLVEGLREVRRVLRDDGVLWLNYGDKYASSWPSPNNRRNIMGQGSLPNGKRKSRPQRMGKGLKEGDLIMLPARVALALQADGWILRDDVIWAKAISFCDKYSGSTMPESVNGWRWERCRVKVKEGIYNGHRDPNRGEIAKNLHHPAKAEFVDCPGCPKCEKNPAVCSMCLGSGKALIDGSDVGKCIVCDGSGIFGGLVLRRGSWRCTKAHEHIFQLTKTNNYFCDMEAVREAVLESSIKRDQYKYTGKRGVECPGEKRERPANQSEYCNPSGRNLRNVWTINPRGYKEAHYATYPEALVEPCIKVSTSAKGVCPKCGSQWARIVESKAVKRHRTNDRTDRHNQGGGVNSCGNTVAGVQTTTLGFKATCDCGIEETKPALVLDPFMGSGTAAVVAAKLGRNYFGCEINPEYKNNHIDKRVRAAETGVPIDEANAGQKGLFE